MNDKQPTWQSHGPYTVTYKVGEIKMEYTDPEFDVADMLDKEQAAWDLAKEAINKAMKNE